MKCHLMLCVISVIAWVCLTGTSSAQNATKKMPNKKPEQLSKTITFDHTHSEFTTLLKNFVIVKGASSAVNYAALKENPQKLNSYLKAMSQVSKQEFSLWNKQQKISFWINAYNAFTLKLIIDNYPLDSIKDIGGFFSSPWKKQFFKLFNTSFYLDKIEHEILRKQFSEPRIHFAVNCASIGCPALKDEAYTAEKLNDQLDEQAKLFLNDSSRNRIDPKSKTIYLSKIFKWFKEDFGGKQNKVIEFALQYMNPKAKTEKDMPTEVSNFDLEYTSYDWSLNGVKK